MASITVHGGDFQNAPSWFYAGGGFVLRGHDGRPARYGLASVAVAEKATTAALRALGGSEALVDVLSRVSVEERGGTFVAQFDDGRILLASADLETYEAITVGRARKVH